MTYAETHKLVKAIDAIETWANAIAREYEKESIDPQRLVDLEKYLKEAKETVFNIASE